MQTQDAIAKKKILDYSDKENQSPDKIPATFTPSTIITESCKSDGKFSIKGTLSKDIKNELSFNIPFTFPEGITATCNLESFKKGDNTIVCKADRDINDPIVFEQIIIKDGDEEIMNIIGYSLEDKIECKNGVLPDTTNKVKNIKVSFRQVSHLEQEQNGFSFFFAAFTSENINAGYELPMKMVVLIGERKKEKEAICKLRNNVQASNGKQVQASFDCEVKLEESEYKQINFANSEAIKVSSDNEGIGGVNGDNEMLSPLATDKAINETYAKRAANETITDLAECLDFSLEENMNKEPPSLEIKSIENMGNKDVCSDGKLTFKGSFSSEITETFTFDLPLSFPSSSLRCTVQKASEGEETEIICNTKKFRLVKSFIIEPRLLQKKYKEVLFIKSQTFEFDEPMECKDYSTLKYQRAKERYKKSHYSFLQLSNFVPGNSLKFFLALVQKKDQNKPVLPTIKVKIKVKSKSIRQLEDITNIDLNPSACEQISSSSAVGLTCSDENIIAEGMELNENTEIDGMPDPADPQLLFYTKNYSDLNTLKTIDSLPRLTIENIDGENCEENGTYTIKATIDGEGELEDTKNVIIPFSSTDSSGLCDIEVKEKKVTMNCHNREKFSSSPILLEQTTIQDSNRTERFIINSYINQKSFSCYISANSAYSTIVPNSSRTSNSLSSNNIYGRRYYKKNTSGISGGAIAALIISIIVALAILTGIIIYFKGKSKNVPLENMNDNSSIQRINVYPKSNNF